MQEIVVTNKRFGWRQDEKYTILDLGTMPNAIVVKIEERGNLWCISLRSYFSFPDNYYRFRFNTEKEAIECACKYMLKWVEELNNHLLNN